jgi:uncharacterized membrane protein
MNTIKEIYLKDAERILRLVMIVTLATAGISKLLSNGTFYDYYRSLFANPSLRINLPVTLVEVHLLVTPFLELSIAIGLLFTRYRRLVTLAWCAFFITIEFGHYVLQEWSAVNEIIPYLLLGTFSYILPNHQSWLKRDLCQ